MAAPVQNFKNSSGVDFNALFEEYTTTKAGTGGIGNYYNSSGTHLNDVFEDNASGTNGPSVNYINSFGGDIGPQWAAIGSVSTAPTWDLNATHVAVAGRFSSGPAYAGVEYQADGDVFTYTNSSGSTKPGGTDRDDITNPPGDFNTSDFQFRVGDFVEVQSGSGQPSRAGIAVTIPTGAIASQSWTNYTGIFEYYYAISTGTKDVTFNIQFKHVPSGDTSSVKQVELMAGLIL